MVEPDRPQVAIQYDAKKKKWDLQAGYLRQESRHTFIMFTTFYSSTAKILRGRASVLRYTYIACRVQIVSIARIITIEAHR